MLPLNCCRTMSPFILTLTPTLVKMMEKHTPEYQSLHHTVEQAPPMCLVQPLKNGLLAALRYHHHHRRHLAKWRSVALSKTYDTLQRFFFFQWYGQRKKRKERFYAYSSTSISKPSHSLPNIFSWPSYFTLAHSSPFPIHQKLHSRHSIFHG